MENSTKTHPSDIFDFQTSALPPPRPRNLFTFDGKYEDTTVDRGKLRGSVSSAHDLYRGLSPDHIRLPTPSNEAHQAAKAEHHMTLPKSLRLYPKAIGWSAMLSLAIVMEGYDTALLNSLYAFGPFQKRYGVPVGNGHYQITAAWQSGLTNASAVGGIIGLFANGILTEILGYRRTMIGALLALAAFIFMTFFASSLGTLLASQVLCGLSWGVFQTLTTTYAADIMPLDLRAALTANVNLCWLIGQLIGAGVLRGMLNFNSEWSYRIPFGLQWVGIVIVLSGVLFAPESPWYFVRKGRIEDARRVLLRLTRIGLDYNVDDNIAMMVHTNELEKKLRAGVSYLDCFKGSNLRRTEIACMVFATQNLCGLPIIGTATYFYTQAGFSERYSFDLNVGMVGLGICASLLAQVMMRYFGRRTLYLWGGGAITAILLTAGSVGTLESKSALWALGSLIVLMIFVFDLTIGPICYCLIAEIPSTRLRVKTVVLSRVTFLLSAIVTNVLQAHMLNPTAWGWKGKTCFFWAGTCSACMIWCYFRLPEPKGLTFEELDILFEKRAGAKMFKKFQATLAATGYFSFYDEDRPEW